MVEGGWSYIESLRLSIGSNEYCRASNAVVIQDKKKANEVKEKKSKPHQKIPPAPVGVYGIITDTKHFNVSDQRVVNNSALKCTHLRANRHTRIRIQYLIRNSLSMCVCQMVCFVEQKRTPVEMCPLCYKINLFCYLHLLLPDVIGVVSRLFRLLRFYLGHKIFKQTMGAIPMQQIRKKNKYKKKTNIHTRVYIYPTDVSTVAHFALLSHSAPSAPFHVFSTIQCQQAFANAVCWCLCAALCRRFVGTWMHVCVYDKHQLLTCVHSPVLQLHKWTKQT